MLGLVSHGTIHLAQQEVQVYRTDILPSVLGLSKAGCTGSGLGEGSQRSFDGLSPPKQFGQRFLQRSLYH